MTGWRDGDSRDVRLAKIVSRQARRARQALDGMRLMRATNGLSSACTNLRIDVVGHAVGAGESGRRMGLEHRSGRRRIVGVMADKTEGLG